MYTSWGLPLGAKAISGESSGLCFWSVVTDSLDVGCHARDLDGYFTVLLDPGPPGAAIPSFTRHVLVGVVVTHIRSGLRRFSVHGIAQFSNICHSSDSGGRKTFD